MPKEKFKTVYVCTNCGESAPRWMGRCPACGAWNTMVEDVVREEKPAKASGEEDPFDSIFKIFNANN